MDELRRHQMVFKVLMPFIHVFNKWKFNYEFDSLKDIEGPFLILPNHNKSRLPNGQPALKF